MSDPISKFTSKVNEFIRDLQKALTTLKAELTPCVPFERTTNKPDLKNELTRGTGYDL